MSKDIWIICCEAEYNKRHIFQLISKACELKEDKSQNVCVVYIGKKDKDFFDELQKYGTNQLILVEVSLINESICTNIIKELVTNYKPFLLMFPSTRYSKVVAARVSSIFNVGLTADCINIRRENDNFVYVRAAINDSIIASIRCVNSLFEMCTVKENVFESKESRDNEPMFKRKFIPEQHLTEATDQKIVLEIKSKEKSNTEKLMAAKIVFGVGRGVSERGYQLLKKVAEKFHAEIVGTRNVVEQGILPKSRQVGQSGVNISPNIYVCLGISGACQHIVGVKNAKFIIAVNTDRDAPVFQYADYAIVEDSEKFLEELLCQMA